MLSRREEGEKTKRESISLMNVPWEHKNLHYYERY